MLTLLTDTSTIGGMTEEIKRTCGNCKFGRQAYFEEVEQTRNIVLYTFNDMKGVEHNDLIRLETSKERVRCTSPAGIQRCCLSWSSLYPRDAEEDSVCVNPRKFTPRTKT